MLEVNKKAAARKYLALFNDDIEAAVAELHRLSAGPQRFKIKVPASAPVVVETQDLSQTYKRGSEKSAAIARALLNKPKVLLADEPTGNLDQTTGSAIIDLFEKIRQIYGATVIVVTHDRSIATRADRE